MTREAIEYFKWLRKIFCEEHLKICPKDSIAYQATLKEKEFYDMAIKALEQEPKTGHWKHDSSNVRCSNCGRGYKDAVGRTSAKTYNFCPNCGADMREVEE